MFSRVCSSRSLQMCSASTGMYLDLPTSQGWKTGLSCQWNASASCSWYCILSLSILLLQFWFQRANRRFFAIIYTPWAQIWLIFPLQPHGFFNCSPAVDVPPGTSDAADVKEADSPKVMQNGGLVSKLWAECSRVYYSTAANITPNKICFLVVCLVYEIPLVAALFECWATQVLACHKRLDWHYACINKSALHK